MKTMNDQTEKMGSLCKFIVVIDFMGVGLSNVRYKPMREFQKQHMNRLQNIQANHSGRIFLINTPWWLKTFWRTIEKWIPENTKRKIFLLGKNYRDELLVLSAHTLQKLLELRQSDSSGNDKEGEVKIPKGKEMEKVLLLKPGQTVKWTFDVADKGGIDFPYQCIKGKKVQPVWRNKLWSTRNVSKWMMVKLKVIIHWMKRMIPMRMRVKKVVIAQTMG